MQWIVYILQCADGTYYCGSTNNLERRLYAHNNLKTGAKYTRNRRPVKLVYSETSENISSARKRENELKSLSHRQKKEISRLYFKV